MDDRDHTGGIAAAAALALLAGTWAWSPAAWSGGDPDGLEQASRQALELQTTGQPLVWDAPDGARAAITPARAFQDSTGRWCRPYSIVMNGGSARQHLGCRDESGQWTTTQALAQGNVASAATQLAAVR